MRLVDADLLLEKWNNMSKKDRTRFDQVILCQPIEDAVVFYDEDNRPECCKAHDKYFSTCDICEYGELEEEMEM